MTAKGSTLPRAYLRMSPNLDQHPDPEGMVLLLCAAARQPQRGRFRDRSVLARVLGPARLKRFIARGDVVELQGGVWYAEGWDEWQEGDYTVGERQRRIRERKRATSVTESRTSNGDVTPSALLDRAAPSEAIDDRRSDESDEGLTRPSSSRGARALSLVDPVGAA